MYVCMVHGLESQSILSQYFASPLYHQRTGHPSHILLQSDLEENNPVATKNPIYLISDLYISDL